MRRSSIITTLFLVLVIIGLVVALVVTNLPPKQEETDPNNGQVVGEENVGEEKEEETPTYVALDSDIAKRMGKIIQPHYVYEYFFDTKFGVITSDTLDDSKKETIAFWNGASEFLEASDDTTYEWMLKKENLDKVMKEIFGSVEYKPVNFYANSVAYIYNSEKQVFYYGPGGGGGPMSHPVTGIYKIEEFSDRYEVYSKYLYLKIQNLDDTLPGVIYDVYDWRTETSYWLTSYKDFSSDSSSYSYIENKESVVDGVEMKSFVKPDFDVQSVDSIEWEFREKLLSKYFDNATEYKHTFMKNEDGTYYWVKSEIIK